MGDASIQIHPVAGALGAELCGVDLSGPLDEASIAAIHAAWMERQVLFLRDQHISREQHVAFGRSFGELHVHPVLRQLEDEGFPEIVVLESDARRPVLADAWHSDVTFQKKPPMGSILRAVTVPEAGGDTMWSSMYAAYEALSDSMQRLLSDLRAVNDGGFFHRQARKAEHREDLEKDQTAVHPVIRTHPVTGRKGIFVNSAFTRSIEGMKPAESRALLGFLYEHVGSPDFTCRLRWQPGTIAMWDNRCTQHRVVADNRSAHRRMERVTLQGDVPI
jgi:taurine dioxygenase